MSDFLYDWQRNPTLRLPDSMAPTTQSWADQGFAGVSGQPALGGNSIARGADGNLSFGPQTAPSRIPPPGFGPQTAPSRVPPGSGPQTAPSVVPPGGGLVTPKPMILTPPGTPQITPQFTPSPQFDTANPAARGGGGMGQPTYPGGGTDRPGYGGYGTGTGQMQPGGYLPSGGAFGSWPDPFSGTQAGNENRSYGRSGLDPRLDAMFQYGLQQALQRYGDPSGMQFYGGPTVAGLSPDEIAAQAMMRQLAGSGGGGVGQAGSDYYNSTLSRALSPQDDPTTQAAINGMSQDTMRAATDPGGLYSQIRQGSINNGTLGSSRQGIAEGIASSRIADTIANNSAQMRLGARGQNLQAAGSAFGNTGNAVTAATLPATLLAGVGGQNRAIDQANMDANLRAWAYNTYEPDRRLQNLYNMMGASPLGGYQAGSNTIGQDLLRAPNGGTSTAQNVAGGVAGGLGLYQILRSMGII